MFSVRIQSRPQQDYRSVQLAIVLGMLVSLLASGCSATNPDAARTSQRSGISVQEILTRLPARDASEQRWASGLLLDAAPASIDEICARLDTARPGSDAQLRYAIGGLTAYATLPGHDVDRAKYAGALCSALGLMHDPQSQSFIIQQIQLAGGQESVGTLRRYLTNEKLCEPSTRALLSIHTPETITGILEAARTVDGARKITLVQALGELRSRDAVTDLMAWAKEDDAPLRDASMAALAKIGDPRAADLIQGASARLIYARSLSERGDHDLSEKICRQLLSAGTEPGVRTAALRQLADQTGGRTMDDLITAARDTNAELRASALDIACGIKGEKTTERWLAALQQADPGLRAGIIRMLGRRNDPAALPAIGRALGDPDAAVRIAAVEAAARVGGVDAVDEILGLLDRTERPDEIAAVRDAILPLPLKHTVPAVVRSLNSATPAARVMLLQFCSGCGTLVPSSAILPLARSESAPVRLAAIRTLENVAEPGDMKQLVQMLLGAQDDAEKNALRRVLAGTASRHPVPESKADVVLAALDTASAANKPVLLQALGKIGGTKSLAALSRGAESKDLAVKDASLRALADWPDIKAFDTLLAVARSKQPLNYRVLALRGCLRMVDESGLPAVRSTPLLKKVLAACERSEEKRLALASLGKAGSREALLIAMRYLNDDAVGLDAALAVRAMAAAEVVEESPGRLSRADLVRGLIERNASPKVLAQIKKYDDASRSEQNIPPQGFVAIFNGVSLDGWKGLVADPPARARMTASELAKAQASADSLMRAQWSVDDGVLMFNADGFANICTAKDYANFELLVDWKIEKKGDSGIYLRGSPQVQIWDPAVGTEGSGGLYNNQKNARTPLQKADKPVGQWNTFRIRMVGERVTVYLNDVLVVDNVVLENYWERNKPIYPTGQIELQAHNSPLYFRNIYIRELSPEKEKYSGLLFNGKDLTGWELVGGSTPWGVKDEVLFTEGGGGGWISTVKEYDNFKLDLEFRVPEGGNSGVFLRTPREGDPAYVGMEIQVLDDYAAVYKDLHSWQYTGSIYGVEAPSVRASKKAGEWQHYVIVADGPHVTVTLNEKLIIDADLISHLDQEETHPGLKRRKGYIGLQNHSTRIEYRNIRITELD